MIHNFPTPRNSRRRCGHHPRLRPRHISPTARLPSNRGCGGIPRSLSVLLLDGHAEMIPAELARGVRHRAPNQLISTRRHYAECRSLPHSARPLFINSGLCIPKAQPTRSPPMRSPSQPPPAAHFTSRPRQTGQLVDGGCYSPAKASSRLSQASKFGHWPCIFSIIRIRRVQAHGLPQPYTTARNPHRLVPYFH